MTAPKPLTAEELAAVLDLLDAFCPECSSRPHGHGCSVARLRATLDAARTPSQPASEPPDGWDKHRILTDHEKRVYRQGWADAVASASGSRPSAPYQPDPRAHEDGPVCGQYGLHYHEPTGIRWGTSSQPDLWEALALIHRPVTNPMYPRPICEDDGQEWPCKTGVVVRLASQPAPAAVCEPEEN